MEEDLCRGWTKSDVLKLYEEASPGERTILETMALHPMATREHLKTSLGAGPDRSVDGYLGNLGKRAYKLNVRDRNGAVTWPFYINTDEDTGKGYYQMPSAVAELIVPGSRAKSKPWEL